MKKTAILLDMGFVFLKLKAALGKRQPTAIEIRQFAMKCLEKDEEIFRIYCYDCPPYGEKQTHPLNKKNDRFFHHAYFYQPDTNYQRFENNGQYRFSFGRIIF